MTRVGSQRHKEKRDKKGSCHGLILIILTFAWGNPRNPGNVSGWPMISGIQEQATGWRVWSSNRGKGKRIWLLGRSRLIFSGHRSSMLRIERPGLEVCHSPPSDAKGKREYSRLGQN